MRGINAAGLAASLAMSDVAAAVAGPAAADAAREQLQRRLQMLRSLQVMMMGSCVWGLFWRESDLHTRRSVHHICLRLVAHLFACCPLMCAIVLVSSPLHTHLSHTPLPPNKMQLAHNDRVSREMRGCLINGHILAVPFSDNYAEAVAQAVIGSGVHRTVDPRVKFAMAACVERLGAAFVACIWVYVAAIRETS